MPWPTVPIVTTGMDADADALPRADILDHATKFNQLIAMRGLADGVCDLDAATKVPNTRLDATLTALAGLATGADQLPYSTGADTFAQTPFPPFSRTVLDDVDAPAWRATLDLATVAQAEAEAGTSTTTRTWTAERVKQAATAASTQVMYVRDEKASGTAGGSAVAGSNTRTLNTVVKNTIAGASLATNDITLPAGTYRVHASGNGFVVNRHRLRLLNVTDAVVAILGSCVYAWVSDGTPTTATLFGEFTITAAKTFRLIHHCETARATDGFGLAVSDTFMEVYTNCIITKVA